MLALALALLFAVVGYFVVNAPQWWRCIQGISWTEHLARLEASGKAVREHFEATRALTIEDMRVGCLAHLIDVGEGRLLCLYGQDYSQFEPHEDDPDINQSRKFPTTSFSLLRNMQGRNVLALFPGPDVIEPTICDPIFDSKKLLKLGIEFKDGEIFTGVSFESASRIFEGKD